MFNLNIASYDMSIEKRDNNWLDLTPGSFPAFRLVQWPVQVNLGVGPHMPITRRSQTFFLKSLVINNKIRA